MPVEMQRAHGTGSPPELRSSGYCTRATPRSAPQKARPRRLVSYRPRAL